MFKSKEGTWTVWSTIDPRWDGHGRSIVEVLSIPEEVTEYIKEKEKELGEPPDDLAWSFTKD